MPSTTVSRTMPSLPAGFRFHPTDEELIVHYLMNQAASIPCPVPIIAEVNIYQCNPWDLPPKALFGENEWYFFSPRDRKYPNGARPNRAAGSGYWKATGTDKAILSTPTSENVGVKKALVFYRGKPPKGIKTDWIMHEYRLTDASNTVNKKNAAKRRGSSPSSMRLDDWVLCRIYKKSNNFQFSDPQEEQDGSTVEEAEPSLNNDNMNGTVASPKSEETVHHATTDDLQLFHNQQLSMTKSCSLTDLLNTIDYTALFFDAPPETEPQQSSLIYTSSPSHQPPNNYNMNSNMPQVDDALCSDYGGASSYNSLNRKRIMTASSFDDGGSSFTKKLPQLPSDSRSGTFFGSSSSYCNQQLAEAASTSSLQYSGLLSHPFLNQQLLLNNHLGMQ